MHTRRSFLKQTALYSAGALAIPSLSSFLPAAADKKTIGIQLYTVRDQMAADPAGTLAKVAQIGYNSLEGATYTGTQKFYGMDPATFAALLKKNGQVMRSCHYRLGEDNFGAPQLINGEFKGTVLHEWDRAVEDAHSLGIQYMVCAWLSPNERMGLDHYKKLAADFNIAGEKCHKAGIQFCYHNHDFEFEAQGGKLPYDILLSETDAGLVKMEMDLYWVSKAGHDPVQLFDAHPGRFPLWHLKDMDKTPAHNFTEVGNGSIDFKRIFANAGKSGMKYFFVEQDKTPGNPLDSITQSIAYIKKNLI